MSVWNKTIGNNSGGGKQVETQGSMIKHERLAFTQIPISRGTEIKSSTANIEKGLTYMYILPWTNLGRPKKWPLGARVTRWASWRLAGRKWQTRTAVFESLDENVARPARHMSGNVDFRPRWARMKPLGEIIDPNTRIWLFNHVSTRVLGIPHFFTKRNTLGAWERLLEAIRSVGKLSLLFPGFPSSSMEVSPLLGWRGWWATKLKAEMRMGDAIEPWSSIQEPWEMDCFYFMVLISSLFFNFVKP